MNSAISAIKVQKSAFFFCVKDWKQGMTMKLFSCALIAVTFAVVSVASPAYACKGATVLLQDDFTDVDPAWTTSNGTAKIGDGKLVAQSDPGKIFLESYEGSFFGAADACVDVSFPSVRDPATLLAGLGFSGADGSYFFSMITADGMASVSRLTGDGWLNPVPRRKSTAIKTAAGAVNTLRVVWQAPPPRGSTTAPDPTVQFFINDQLFIKFKATPNSNRKLFLYGETEGAQFQFNKLIVTK
jgi:hypothetical protein